jgi:CubicO group peptidase (beta-lactamase class C family)
MRVIFLCLFFVAALARADNRFDPVRAFIREQIAARHLPSVTIAVAKHGKIVWEEGFGWANRERRIAATPETLYSLASINKPFTCTALMTLVQAGKIDLDRPANDYLGAAKLRSFAFDVRGATVRRLANHTSGLPAYVHFYFTDGKPPIPPPDAMLAKYGVLIAPPGEHYQYSNVGMQALGTIGTRATGLSYVGYMERTVFRPLGLTHTAVGVPASPRSKRSATTRPASRFPSTTPTIRRRAPFILARTIWCGSACSI